MSAAEAGGELFWHRFERESQAGERAFVARHCATAIRRYVRVMRLVREQSKHADGARPTVESLVGAPSVPGDDDPLLKKLDRVSGQLVACIEQHQRDFADRVTDCADGPAGSYRAALAGACQGGDLVKYFFHSMSEADHRTLLRFAWNDAADCERLLAAFLHCAAPADVYPRDGFDFKALAMVQSTVQQTATRYELAQRASHST